MFADEEGRHDVDDCEGWGFGGEEVFGGVESKDFGSAVGGE